MVSYRLLYFAGMRRFVNLLVILAILPLALPSELPAQLKDKPAEEGNKNEPIVGKWRWSSGYDTEFFPDGTVSLRGNQRGTWRRLPSSPPKYEMVWPDQNNAKDLMSLSADGQSMKGFRISQTKDRIQWTARRLP